MTRERLSDDVVDRVLREALADDLPRELAEDLRRDARRACREAASGPPRPRWRDWLGGPAAWRPLVRHMRNRDTRKMPYGTGELSNLDTVQGVLDYPGRNWMLSATGILDATTSLEISVGSANNRLDLDTESPALRCSTAGLTGFPLLYPEGVQEDYIPTLFFSGGRVAHSPGWAGSVPTSSPSGRRTRPTTPSPT